MEAMWISDKPKGNDTAAINEPFGPNELARAVHQCKKVSAPGADGITYEMVHHLPTLMFDRLLTVYNRVWEEGKMIPSWKESLVVPILKPNASRERPESYRPIALTACLCKLFERMVKNRLEWYLEANKLINPLQSGFRKQRCTTDHVVRLQDAVHKAINTGKHTLAVFLDFSKAFDMVWKEGLLSKLRQLGVGGNMHRFIDDFLSDRKIRVVVGGQMSGSYSMENGTPQGSVISPTLFNIMINDFPTPTDPATEGAIFADDGSAWRSGGSVKLLNKALQNHLDRVSDWSDQWGFKLSESKSTAVLFTKSHKAKGEEELQLTIKGTPIKIDKQFKFLGVTFDRRLTWNAHITAAIDKAKKASNLMRNVSGQKWGASKASLLSIYRALIRSKFEFGCEAYYTASDSVLGKLDAVQRRALMKCCGAFCTTPSCALQQDCGEMPLALRRKSAALRFLTKVSANDDNPARLTLRPHWTADYGTFHEGKGSYHSIWLEYQKNMSAEVASHRVMATPPWQLTPPTTDRSLTSLMRKTTSNPTEMKAYSMSLIDSYNGRLHIYTDASKMADGRAGAAFYVDSIGWGHAARLTDDVSIYAAELTAIQMAVNWLLTSARSTQEVVIFTDSLSSVESFRNQASNSQPIIFAEAMTSLNRLQQKVTVAWIPSHTGIRGNDIVDDMAKHGALRAAVEIALPLEYQQEKTTIGNYILGLWQAQYDREKSGAFYREIEPIVSSKIKYSSTDRRKEVTISRLRLGKCRLNFYLQVIKRHEDGLCDRCGTEETIEHLLLQCDRSNMATTVASRCAALGLPLNVNTILSTASLQDLVYHLLTINDIMT